MINLELLLEKEKELIFISSRLTQLSNERTNLINYLSNENRIIPESEINNDLKENKKQFNETIKEYGKKLREIYTLIND